MWIDIFCQIVNFHEQPFKKNNVDYVKLILIHKQLVVVKGLRNHFYH